MVRTWVAGPVACLALALLGLAGYLCAQPGHPPPVRLAERIPALSSYFGMNGSRALQFRDPEARAVVERLEWMQELGVRWERTEFARPVVERRPGVYDWSRPDRALERFEQAGIQWLPVLSFGAAGGRLRKSAIREADVARFARFVHQAVSRYQGRVPFLEFRTEPVPPQDGEPKPDPDRESALLQAASQAARQADPGVRLGAAVAVPVSGPGRRPLERLFQRGALDHFDVLAYHYYRADPPEQDLPAELALIRALMARYGTVKPIWITETGVSSGVPSDAGAHAEPVVPGEGAEAGGADLYDRQAAFVVRTHLLALALGVERVFYYDLQNWFDDQPAVWESTLGLVDASGRQKPAFHAYRTMVRETDGKEFVGRLTLLPPGVEGVLIRDRPSGVYTMAVWTQEENRPRTVELAVAGEAGEFRIVTPDGSTTSPEMRRSPEQESGSGMAAVRVDHHPRYLVGVAGADWLADAAVQLLPVHTIAVPGEERPLEVLATSPHLAEPGFRILETTVPKGLHWDPAEGRIRLDEKAEPGRYRIEALIEVLSGADGHRHTVRLRRSALVEVVPSLTLNLRLHRNIDGVTTAGASLPGGRPLYVETTLTNSTVLPVTGTLRLLEHAPDAKEPVVLGAEDAGSVLAPFETRTVHFAIPMDRVRHYTGVTTLTAEFGPHRSRPFHVVPVPFTESSRVPRVDGDLSDWPASLPPVRLNQERPFARPRDSARPPADASAELRFWFTPEQLFVAARVRDDEPPFNTSPPQRMRDGDALELFLGLLGPTRRTAVSRDIEYQIGLAPTGAAARPEVFWFHEEVPLRQAELAVRPEEGKEGGYVMEASLALGELHTPVPVLVPGGLVALDAALYDTDRDDPASDAGGGAAPGPNGRSLIWNGTPMNGTDPSGWGVAVLVPLPEEAGE